MEKGLFRTHLERSAMTAAASIFFLFIASPLPAETWSKRYIASLPDSAFASVETTPGGKKIRHLPHHDQNGEVDFDHLKSALGRIHQVKWQDPANFTKAKIHLEEHYRSQADCDKQAIKFMPANLRD